VWALLGGQRILVRYQPTQQRYQVYVSVACDTR
jgi:glutathionyl-hydroquinone reductase